MIATLKIRNQGEGEAPADPWMEMLHLSASQRHCGRTLECEELAQRRRGAEDGDRCSFPSRVEPCLCGPWGSDPKIREVDASIGLRKEWDPAARRPYHPGRARQLPGVFRRQVFLCSVGRVAPSTAVDFYFCAAWSPVSARHGDLTREFKSRRARDCPPYLVRGSFGRTALPNIQSRVGQSLPCAKRTSSPPVTWQVRRTIPRPPWIKKVGSTMPQAGRSGASPSHFMPW